jgi:hypothetical protein
MPDGSASRRIVAAGRDCNASRPFALLASLAHVREAVAIWRNDSSSVRPHSALGNLAPAVYAKKQYPGTRRDGTMGQLEAPLPIPLPDRANWAQMWIRTLLVGG